MDRDSFVLPNTLRDSNDMPLTRTGLIRPSIPSAEDMDITSEPRHSIVRPVEHDHSLPRRGLIRPFVPSFEEMDCTSEAQHSIVRPVEPDHSLSSHFEPSNHNYVVNKPLSTSIIRRQTSDDERSIQETTPSEQFINENNNILLQATGFDSSRLAEVDADAAYALQLQQEEYSRESLMPNRHRYLPFRIEPDDESNDSNSGIVVEPDPPRFNTDAEFAAYLQEQENRERQRAHRQPFPFVPIRQRSNPGSTRTSETDESEQEPNPFVRFSTRQPPFLGRGGGGGGDDDDDDDNPQIHDAHAFLQFLANSSGHPMRGNFPAFLSGLRRGRRTGNLQDTEDDFGPEDYERLLQLDDAVHKKKLSKNQINSIPEIKFQPRNNNTDEENKCGVCLELFEENQPLRQFPCKHVYHKECGDRWLQESNVCPICRKPPIEVHSSSSSRHHHHHHQPRGTSGPRRPIISNRTASNRNNNNTNNNSNNNHRRGPPAPPHHQS